MKKLIDIPEDVFKELRVRAAKKGMPLSHYIKYYLTLHVSEKKTTKKEKV